MFAEADQGLLDIELVTSVAARSLTCQGLRFAQIENGVSLAVGASRRALGVLIEEARTPHFAFGLFVADSRRGRRSVLLSRPTRT